MKLSKQSEKSSPRALKSSKERKNSKIVMSQELVSVRPKVATFKEGDEKKWLKIVNSSMKGSQRKPLKLKDIKEFKRSPYFDPSGVFFAYVDDKPVGVCQASLGAFFETEKGHIGSFHVLPQYHGTSIEKELHQLAIDHLKTKGLKEVETSFSDDESHLRSFFSSQGYRVHRIYLIMKRGSKNIQNAAVSENVVVQPLQRGQLQAFVDVANKAFSDAFSYYDFEPATVEELKKQMRTYRVAYDDIKIAYSNGEPVGYVYTVHEQIAGIGVIREHRRKNIGTLLLTEGLKHVHSKGFKEASLGVNEQNKPAVNFFRKHAFQESKRLIFMRKTLRRTVNTD